MPAKALAKAGNGFQKNFSLILTLCISLCLQSTIFSHVLLHEDTQSVTELNEQYAQIYKNFLEIYDLATDQGQNLNYVADFCKCIKNGEEEIELTVVENAIIEAITFLENIENTIPEKNLKNFADSFESLSHFIDSSLDFAQIDENSPLKKTDCIKNIFRLYGDVVGTTNNTMITRVGGCAAALIGKLICTATSACVPNTLVLRDSTGRFCTITDQPQHAPENFSGILEGDVTGPQNATVVNCVGGCPANTIGSLICNATSSCVPDTLVQRDTTNSFCGTLSANSTIAGCSAATVATLICNATSNCVPNTLVQRDDNGAFCGTLNGNITGTAQTNYAYFYSTNSDLVSIAPGTNPLPLNHAGFVSPEDAFTQTNGNTGIQVNQPGVYRLDYIFDGTSAGGNLGLLETVFIQQISAQTGIGYQITGSNYSGGGSALDLAPTIGLIITRIGQGDIIQLQTSTTLGINLLATNNNIAASLSFTRLGN